MQDRYRRDEQGAGNITEDHEFAPIVSIDPCADDQAKQNIRKERDRCRYTEIQR